MVETSRGKQCDGKSFPPTGREAATFAARGSEGALKLPPAGPPNIHFDLRTKSHAMTDLK